MRRNVILLAAAVIVVLGAAGAAWGIGDWFGSREAATWGGGRYDIDCTTVPAPCRASVREFNIDAHAGARGFGATGSFSWGDPVTGRTPIVGHVTCLRVDRDSAPWSIAGGIVDRGDPVFTGLAFFFYSRDLGPPGSLSRDLVALGLSRLDSPQLPPGFPARCPTLDELPVAFRFPVVAGDVAVRD